MEEKETKNEIVSSDSLPALNKEKLDQESQEIINQIITETDSNKTKDLTNLFNQNQNKKTMMRVDKLGKLSDTIIDQTIKRFTQKPDEISNQELLQGLKVVQDAIERGQKQVSGMNDAPLIQVNQQNNEIKLGETGENLNRESRDKVKNAVLSILAGIKEADTPMQDEEIIVEEENK